MAETSIPHNWAGNVSYRAAAVHRPESVEQVQELVARRRQLKVVGTRHSFNGVADTSGDHLSLERLNRIIALDRAARTVTIEAGVRYGELGQWLHREGFALHNLASLPHISVAGAVATATHGSGDRLGNLATAVAAMEVVTDDGTLMEFLRRDHPVEFPGVVVGLGALGVVTRLTLEVEPTYDVLQFVCENLPLAGLIDNFDAITARATSVSLFTDWRQDGFHQWWLKQRVETDGDRVVGFEKLFGPESGPFVRDAFRPLGPVNRVFPPDSWVELVARQFFGTTLATRHVHPIPGHAAENCSRQVFTMSPWHDQLPHFRLEFTPSSGAELQSEYFVRRADGVAALRALFRMRNEIAPHIFVTEVRTIAADDLWLSPCYQQACVAIHFTWKPDWPAVGQLLPRIEGALAPFDARPHWGKLFTMAPESVRALYPKLPDFLQLRARLDPTGKFRNAFLDELFPTDAR